MGRKSKHAGSGHLPLTNYERKEIGKNYGTTKARLSSVSQQTFGHCALSLHPATEQPVATPSGYIYNRPSILEYLLHQTQELKKAQQRYDQGLKDKEIHQRNQREEKRKAQVEKFEETQKIVTKKQKTGDDTNPLARSSYWLADFQPVNNVASDGTPVDNMDPPPDRPCSPMTQEPLRRKDLIPIELKRNLDGQVICAISEKSIVTQSAVALIPVPIKKKDDAETAAASSSSSSSRPAQVVLEQVFQTLGDTKICPITGRKIVKILTLQSGGSSFAGSGRILEAQTYRPGMT